MKQIHICSRKEFRWLLRSGEIPPESAYALISSSYPLELPDTALPGYSFRLYDDIDYDCPGRSFSEEAAACFAQAIRENGQIRDWYFVCDGGCRRSAAIACSALRCWDREREELAVWGDPRREPNVLVYRLMCEALGVPVGDDELDLRIHINRTAIKTARRKSGV